MNVNTILSTAAYGEADALHNDLEFQALQRYLSISKDSFSFAVCICNEPVQRDNWIHKFTQSDPQISVVTLTTDNADPLTQVLHSKEDSRPSALFLTGMEIILESDENTRDTGIAALNRSREHWKQHFQCPVVFWLTTSAIDHIARSARDFWSWVGHEFEFKCSVSETTPRHTPQISPGVWQTYNLNQDAKEKRLVELEKRLSELGRAPPKKMRSHFERWWIERLVLLISLGKFERAQELIDTILRKPTQLDSNFQALLFGLHSDILYARGQLDDALNILQKKELPVFEKLGNVQQQALTMGRIADILQVRGELDEALRIRHEKVLPVFEQLGDLREIAVTKGRIADILQVRGELEKALKIRKEEELPVYEKLGDVRQHALTMGRIADILEARGQLDEALRIREEEELPVYTELGDVRSQALTKGKIANILQARGQLDEALKIRRNEELPVYEKLKARRDICISRAKIALGLLTRDTTGDREEAIQLLGLALDDAKAMKIPEARRIQDILLSTESDRL